MRISVGFLLAAIIIIVASCTKATLVGDELLDEEKANIIFKDDFTLSFNSVVDDSVLVYPTNIDRPATLIGTNRVDKLLLGKLDDPIFGKSSSEIYTQVGLNLNFNPLSLVKGRIDSIILKLTIDTIGFYGDENALLDIEVREVLEPLVAEGSTGRIYADQSFMVDQSRILGEAIGINPSPTDTVITSYANDTMIVESPHIRIPLTLDALDKVRLDSAVLLSQDSLNTLFHGININVTSQNNRMIGVEMLSVSGVQVYYTDTTGTTDALRTYIFSFLASAKSEYIVHDYIGSIVEPFLGEAGEDSILFIQSMLGINTELFIDDLDLIQGSAINDAELEMYAIELPGDDIEMYTPVQQVVSLHDRMGITRSYSDDVIFALGSSLNRILLETAFGGFPNDASVNNPKIRKYTFKITAQLQNILHGDTDRVIFSSYLKAMSPERSVFVGMGNSSLAPRLKITYTKL